MRSLVGFVVSAMAPAVFLATLNAATAGAGGGTVIFTLAFSCLGAALFGVPVHLIFRRLNVQAFLPYVAAGAVIGVLCYGISILPQIIPIEAPLSYVVPTVVRATGMRGVIGFAGGAIAGGVFWIIAVRKAGRSSA
jgi:hypothetical protein